MLWIGANHAQMPASRYELAITADFFYGGFDFHLKKTTRRQKQGKNPYFFYFITLLNTMLIMIHLFRKNTSGLKPFYNPTLASIRIKHQLDRVPDQNFDRVHAHLATEIS